VGKGSIRLGMRGGEHEKSTQPPTQLFTCPPVSFPPSSAIKLAVAFLFAPAARALSPHPPSPLP
jgi:hypothetical protein